MDDRTKGHTILVLEAVFLAALNAFAAQFGKEVLVASMVISFVGWLWLHGYLPVLSRRRRKGRMGLLNARADVPAAMAAQDKRLWAIADLIGRLDSVWQTQTAKPRPTTRAQQIELANETAAAFRKIATKLQREADGFKVETARFTSGIDRWLEIAVADTTNDGFEEQQQVPNLARMVSSGMNVLPTLREKRQMFEKLRGAADTMDASCGQVVEAFDVLIGATEETVATSERSLKRIKAILERFLASKRTDAGA